MNADLPGHTGRTESRKTIAIACIAAFWSVVFLYVLVHSLPYNPIGSTAPDRIGLRTFIPEGWAFFTKDPQERQFEVFVERGGQWVPALQTPVARPENVFGLNRAARAQGVELSVILEHVPDDAWRACALSDLECLAAGGMELEVLNRSSRQSLCGRIGVVLRDPVPWAWRSARDRIHMPGLATDFTVRCS